ncbi:hypothetical protein A2130_00575 [Candidatus Woesebacteria bacterium GWC2_33_12]|uniref:Type 4 fimbrial biogenesis protein PilX N-terminal domain-containing protein n=1 Tax=Candidatus Woesebacteria bacterium GW2011_GWB1_33_22 TaxID=1618566 RepID=A0A0G0A247_9BACT|nr:MAG: hypothetical protein UR29_C0002G0006 [Candidatus Woesebacteria bacterium GW2011_GWC2_33_12]KKP42478.1 MAG: hypothetical protein UR33_C0002G0054 [Candidatus Woesebacteria bacterium GW2011_GWA2_33_20]KKP45221.1 MAG: hypothetical protein UR35_C0002G0054 [Candidatus Woesebacteria bacterium GW2011_GWB1_33_22]KKP46484.1 MAG: hypothetical protein UR37_C0007G0041 [Microgenomates group bacterium GW2011_GWC1_33_28]KKP50891.1 MAG: hypothetical protein UR41_C0002G0055 [Candidatus Woesebacteria bact
MKSRNNEGPAYRQAGQAVLIVLLSLSVVLIIVLYIMSRSVTDLSLSSKEEDSLRAFSAAEAGIERALILGSTGPSEIGGANFEANVSSFGQGETSVVYPVSLKSGEIAVFWFAPHQGVVGDSQFDGNQVTFCWGDSDTPVDGFAPAIELTVYYGDISNLQIARAVFDPNSARAESNGFDSVNSNCTIENEDFEFETNVNLASLGANSDLKYANVRILYNTTVAHKIGIDVTGFGLLPSQGNKVISSGSFGGANRKIEVYETYKVAPPIFENSIFSASGVVK